jgi:3-deoxy-7-phosphoheptulonate synthase
MKQWNLESWRKLNAAQQPNWPDKDRLLEAVGLLKQQPPLVFAGEVRSLKNALAEACAGKAFILQGGDCAEEFKRGGATPIREKLKILLQMSVALTFGTLKPVVKIGRIAGQYAKPRSKSFETIQGQELPVYRGDAVNGIEPTLESRTPDPQRMVRAYYQSSATINLLRAFTHGGFANLSHVNAWNNDYVKESKMGAEYQQIADEIARALSFMKACGLESEHLTQLHQVDMYTSHEALLLEYEAALTREDSLTGDWYNCSGHMLWVGDRTRQLDGAHIEYLSGIENPIGIKIGPSFEPNDLDSLATKLNPNNEPGKLMLITRFGWQKIQDYLPPLIKKVREKGLNVVWSCDPMHGNTFVSPSGYKTRHFDHILKELTAFFDIHNDSGTFPGGIHFELTGEHVTECLGGADNIQDNQLACSYETACDPRLNAKQSLQMAFIISRMMQKR